MDFTNTLWVCFICAGLTCLRTLLFQRLRDREPRSKRLLHDPRCQAHFLNLKSSARSGCSGPRRPLQERAPYGDSLASKCCDDGKSSVSYDCLPGNPCRTCFPQAECDSAACSVAGSASSSRSSFAGDSDEEAEGCCPQSSAGCSDDERTDSRTLSPCHGSGRSSSAKANLHLRPAIRTPGRSALAGQTGELGRKSKSVTFNTVGAVICSPPTLESLDLLAAGTPPLAVSPPCCTSSSVATSSTASPGILVAPRANDGVGGVEPDAGRATAASTQIRAAAPAQSLTAASQQPAAQVTRIQAAGALHLRPGRSLPARSEVYIPNSATVSAVDVPRPGCVDSAHALALARAAVGRRRVLAALEEAKSRHSHLGQRPDVDSWSACTRGHPHQLDPDVHQRLLPSEAGVLGTALHQEQQWNLKQACPERERLIRLPNLPLASRDLDILSVGYAANEAPARVLSTKDPLGPGEWGRAEASSQAHEPGDNAAVAQSTDSSWLSNVLAGGIRAKVSGGANVAESLHAGSAAALSQFPSMDRLRMAEALAKQSYQLRGWQGHMS